MTAERDDLAETDELGEVIFSCLQTLEAGQAVDREELKARYPQFAAELERFFVNQEQVERLASPLRDVMLAATPPLADTLPASPGPAVQVLRTFGDYDLLAKVGRGGMGMIYQARQRSLNRLVALKIISAGQLASGKDRLHFRAEAETAAFLDHPHIIPIHEVGEVEDQLFFSMKFVEGGSLATRVVSGEWRVTSPEDNRRAAQLVATIAQAVHYAQQCGILHRDLKPANILLDSEGRPYISDFGLAKRLPTPGQSLAEELAQSGHIVGSPLYMAPEQAAPARGPATVATDVYGLGGILYVLLTSRAPFQGDTILDTLDRVLNREPDPPRRHNPQVHRDLEAICLKCLEKEPARRYASAQQVTDDLGRFLRGEPIRARPVSSVVRLGRWARRQPALAALVATCIVSALALLAGVLWHNAQLQAALTNTRAEQERADRHYRKARDGLNQMLNRLEAPGLADTPRLQEVQKQLHEVALAFFYDILTEPGHMDPAVRRDLALAYARVAEKQHVLQGGAAAAEQNCRTAIALLEALPVQERESQDVQVLLAKSYHNLGAMVGNHEEAEACYHKALAIYEQVLQANPENTDWRRGQAQTYHNLGALNHSKDPSAAVKYYEKSMAIVFPLLGPYPEDATLRSGLAEDCLTVGLLYSGLDESALPLVAASTAGLLGTPSGQQPLLATLPLAPGRADKADAAFLRAEALLNPLVTKPPINPAHALLMTMLYLNWSYRPTAWCPAEERMRQMDRAVELAKNALHLEPHSQKAHELTYKAYARRAEIYQERQRWREAVVDWDSAIKLRPNWKFRAFRAMALVMAQEHTRGTAEAEATERDLDVPADGLLYLTGVYTLAVPQAQTDAGLTTAERTARADRYGARAVALLRKLQVQGYFKDPGHAQILKTDPELDPVRDRADFQQLLRSVEATKTQ
jgi:tetratricopeptide (TPR) repeat protein